MPNNILEVIDVTASYNHGIVLSNINLSIPEMAGRYVVGVVGRNGSGKTTLLKIICGLLKPRTGKVIFNGKDITNLPPWIIWELGVRYVPSENKIFHNLSTLENLHVAAYKIKDKDIANKQIEKVLAMFPRLRERLNIKAGRLSGGERQMLNIAMSLIGGAKFLLIDEPTEGLAPAVVNELVSIIKRLEIPMILVEQNIPVIMELSDNLFVLNEGKILYVANSKEEIQRGYFKRYL